MTMIVDGLKHGIQSAKVALAALDLKSRDSEGRVRQPREVWSRAQLDQLSKARIALMARMQHDEFLLRMIESSNDRPRTRAQREAPLAGTDLRPLLEGR